MHILISIFYYKVIYSAGSSNIHPMFLEENLNTILYRRCFAELSYSNKFHTTDTISNVHIGKISGLEK